MPNLEDGVAFNSPLPKFQDILFQVKPLRDVAHRLLNQGRINEARAKFRDTAEIVHKAFLTLSEREPDNISLLINLAVEAAELNLLGKRFDVAKSLSLRVLEKANPDDFPHQFLKASHILTTSSRMLEINNS